MQSQDETWTFQNIKSSPNIYDIKSSILTFLTLYPASYVNKSKLFYDLLEICYSNKLVKNNLENNFGGDGNDRDHDQDHQKLLKIFNKELSLLKADLTENCQEDYFWKEIETSLMEVSKRKVAKKSKKSSNSESAEDPRPPSTFSKYLKSLKAPDHLELYEKNLKKLENAQNYKRNLVKTCKIVLNYVSLNNEKLPEYLRDLCEKLLKYESEGQYEIIDILKSEHPSASNFFTLCNNMNTYRECFVFDVIGGYVSFQKELQEKVASLSYNPLASNAANSLMNASATNKANMTPNKIYYKYFRKAIEYGIGCQMFLMQNYQNKTLKRSAENLFMNSYSIKKRKLSDDYESCDVDNDQSQSLSSSPFKNPRSTNISNFWLQIGKLRKNVGSLEVCNWRNENSNIGDLFSLYKSVIKLINEPKLHRDRNAMDDHINSNANSHNVISSSILLLPKNDASFPANSPESKQLFYTCLQIVVQASGAYCELVEPMLIYGSEEAYERSKSGGQDRASSPVLVKQEAQETAEDCNSGSPSLPFSIFPIKPKAKDMLVKLGLMDNSDEVVPSNRKSRANSGQSKSRHSSGGQASLVADPLSSNYPSAPTKYKADPSQLLFIFQQTEKILENDSLCGPDWEKQMKKKWHVEHMPFWVLTKSTLEFINGQFEQAIESLTNLDQNLRDKKYFGFEIVGQVLERRINMMRLLAGVELRNFSFIEEGAQKLLSGSESCPEFPETSQVFAACPQTLAQTPKHNFIPGKDFINRSMFSSLLYTDGKISPNPGSILDNENLFFLIGSQLFWESSNEESTERDLSSSSSLSSSSASSPDPLKLRVEKILTQIEQSAIVEEELEEADQKLARNFDFIKLLENTINMELLEKIQDTRLIWKNSYISKREEFIKIKKQKLLNEKNQKNSTTTGPKSKKSRRRQPVAAVTEPGSSGLDSFFGKSESSNDNLYNTNPKDEDAYNNALEEALNRCDEVDLSKNIRKIEGFLSKLAGRKGK